MNTNPSPVILPPRGSRGRFMPRVPVASFVYWKPDSGNSFRKVVVSPEKSIGNYLCGLDLHRKEWRTFRRSSIVGEVDLRNEYLDTVSLEAKEL